ncbi:MAG: helix-turn-helix domain-containing protein [Maricaulaceae bacterium]
MSDFGKDLIESLGEAVAHAKGDKTTAKEHVLEAPDVEALRQRLAMSQAEFAEAYRIPLPTLKGWEQGRRQPDATAAAFLNVIASMPEETRGALRS